MSRRIIWDYVRIARMGEPVIRRSEDEDDC